MGWDVTGKHDVAFKELRKCPQIFLAFCPLAEEFDCFSRAAGVTEKFKHVNTHTSCEFIS